MTRDNEPDITERSVQVIVQLGLESRAHPLPAKAAVRIGRGQQNTIGLDDPAVSRQHAILHVDGMSVQVEDLGSPSGTFVARKGATIEYTPDGAKGLDALVPHTRVALRVGDSLRIGHAILSLHARSDDVTSPASSQHDLQLADPAMVKARELTARAAGTDLSVLILGETGVGKDVMARALHALSPRSAGPFTAINCAAMPDNLVASALFGNEKGAFTGADSAKAGLLEATAKGTLFLDEIAELALGTQALLLRVLEDRMVLRIGATEQRSVDVRFVCATHRNLRQRVRDGGFRSDLYYRISGIVVHIPPLRERIGEIAPLTRLLMINFCAALALPMPELTPEALRILEGHSWPGNVRELKNVMERAVILSAGETIGPAHIHLDPSLGERDQVSDEASTEVGKQLPPLNEIVNAERARVIAALKACGGNQTRAAQLLGISRSALIHRIQRFDLPRPTSS